MDLLTADHRHIEECLGALRRSLPGPQRTSLVTELNGLIVIHLQVEEATLHPMMRDLVGSSQEEESDVEHELIRGMLAQATQLVDAPGFRCSIEMLSAAVQRHVDDEERILLPLLLGQLTRDEAIGVGCGVARRTSRSRRISDGATPLVGVSGSECVQRRPLTAGAVRRRPMNLPLACPG